MNRKLTIRGIGSLLTGAARPVVVRLICAGLVVYVAALLLATHVPEDRLPWGKVGEVVPHCLGYAGLTMLVIGATAAMSRTGMDIHPSRYPWATSLIIVLVAAGALLDELTQPLTGRSFEWRDWTADVAGVVGAVFLLEVLQLMRKTVRLIRT